MLQTSECIITGLKKRAVLLPLRFKTWCANDSRICHSCLRFCISNSKGSTFIRYFRYTIFKQNCIICNENRKCQKECKYLLHIQFFLHGTLKVFISLRK